jgi:predicted nuclease of predicted toxin-antitoxin system
LNGYYFDEHIDRVIADALIARGVPVVMAVDVGMTSEPDELHLDYATEHRLVMVTFDQAFIGRTMPRTNFFALVGLTTKVHNDLGAIIDVLLEFAQLFDPERDKGQVFWLP